MTLNFLNVSWPVLYNVAIETSEAKFANVNLFVTMETSLNGH